MLTLSNISTLQRFLFMVTMSYTRSISGKRKSWLFRRLRRQKPQPQTKKTGLNLTLLKT
jgi:hypothetical protein